MRALVVLGIVVALGAAAMWYWTRDKPVASSEAGSSGSSQATPGLARPTVAPGATAYRPRALPKTEIAEATLPDGGIPSPDQAFEAEQRDGDWAPGTEAEIHKRFQLIRGSKLTSVECRDTECRLILDGSQADLQRTIADLEGAHGLHGYAHDLLLTMPKTNADGSVTLHAFARFNR
ncbi:MAG TPA: hypothetical protein VGM88_13755 [Kofleriaceae bacterium]